MSDQILILDVPPLTPIPDARIMTALSDGLIMVVRVGKTPYGCIEEAFKAVDRSKRLCAVLNDVEDTPFHSYYSGYYRCGHEIESQGNLPMTEAQKVAIRLNTPEGIDAALSNATLTSHVSALHAFFASMILPQGIFPGHTLETLNNVRYFEIDNGEELNRKWPLILAQKNDFIKTYLWLTDNVPLSGRRR